MYKRMQDCHVKPTFGSFPITAIKPLGIQVAAYDDSRVCKRYHYGTAQDLDRVRMLELLPINPASVTYRMPKQSNKLDTRLFYSLV